MLRFEYFNLTDSVTVYTDNTQSVRANNDYSLTAQSPLTCPVSFGTFTTNTTSIVLSELGFNSAVDSRLNNVTINDSYTFKLIRNDPNLLVDFNFNNSFESDYTNDSSVLVFEPNDATAVTLSEGYVTVNPNSNYINYIELTTSLPAYLKNTGDHSWVIQFRLLLNRGFVRLAFTTSPSSKAYLNFTGVLIDIINHASTRLTILVIYYKNPGDELVRASNDIPSGIDLSIGIHQIVTTYNESTRTLNLYFDDMLLVTSVASSTDPIFYEVNSSIVLNKIENFGNRDERTEYHKVACYDKILTQSEVIDLYTNTNTFTNANMATINTVSNISFSSLEPETSYVIQLTDFVHNPLNSPGSRLQYANFPTSVSLLTGKFSAPTINDLEASNRTSDTVYVGFTPPEVDELQGYLTRNGFSQFEAKFSVASTEHNQSDIIKYLDYTGVVTNGTSTVPIDGLLPNTLYTITLTGFEYTTPARIPFITFVQSSVNTLYTSTDNMVFTYDSVTHNIVDDDGDVALTFTNIRAIYDTSYTYNAYIFINGTTQIGTISDIGSSTTSFTTVSDPAIPYYDSGADPLLTIKFRNMSFTNNPYVKENRGPPPADKVVVDSQLLKTGGVTIIITVETIVLNANENIVITMASTANTLLPDVGTFKPNDLYRFKYTVSYE
jgi:hypothetical protein